MFKKIIYAAMAFSPVFALAQSAGTGAISTTAVSITDLGSKFITIVKNVVIPAVFALAIIYFFYGLAKTILGAGDPKKTAEGRSIMIYGIIALVVMASLFGIINFVQNSLGINGTGTTVLPGGGTF